MSICSLLIKAYPENQRHSYLCPDGQLSLIKPLKRLTFSQILNYVLSDIANVQENQKKKLGTVLSEMVIRKKYNELVSSLIQRVCNFIVDFFVRLDNWFRGNGFVTDCQRAQKLINKLFAHASLGSQKLAKTIAQQPIVSFRRDPNDPTSDLIPIQLRAGDIVGKGATIYKQASGRNVGNANYIEGSFTYCGASLEKAPPAAGVQKFYQDEKWGAGWRTILNQCNNLIRYLKEEKGINPLPEYDREIGMHDIQELTKLLPEVYLEPFEAIEFYLRFIKAAYEEKSQQKFLRNFIPFANLYLNKEKNKYTTFIQGLIGVHLRTSSRVANGEPLFRLKETASFLWQKNTTVLKTALDRDSDDADLTACRAGFKNLYWGGLSNQERRLTDWYAYLVLHKLIPENKAKTIDEVPEKGFPVLDEEHPIPLILDNELSCLNIYGYNAENEKVTDLFVARTHVGDKQQTPQDPRKACEWVKTEDIFLDRNIIIYGLGARR